MFHALQSHRKYLVSRFTEPSNVELSHTNRHPQGSRSNLRLNANVRYVLISGASTDRLLPVGRVLIDRFRLTHAKTSTRQNRDCPFDVTGEKHGEIPPFLRDHETCTHSHVDHVHVEQCEKIKFLRNLTAGTPICSPLYLNWQWERESSYKPLSIVGYFSRL